MVALEARQHATRPEAIARLAAAHPVTYVVYDLLYLRGRPVLKEPLLRRRPRMFEAIRSSGRIYVIEPVADDGLAFFDAAREKGLEGVVAKRFDSPYRPGQRHPDWLQIDAVRRQDFVVLGFIPHVGDHLLEALIIGTYDGRTFQPAGRVVGGFDRSTSIRLRKILDGLPAAPPSAPTSRTRTRCGTLSTGPSRPTDGSTRRSTMPPTARGRRRWPISIRPSSIAG